MHACMHICLHVCMYAHWQHRALVHGNCGDQRIRPEQTIWTGQYGATVEHVCPTTKMMGVGGGGGGGGGGAV